MTSRMRRRLVSESRDRAALVGALQARPGQRFRASDLKRLTGVPKACVRRLLDDVDGVSASLERGTFWFSRAEESAPSPVPLAEGPGEPGTGSE